MKDQRLLLVMFTLLSINPAKAEEWTGTAIGTNGPSQLKLNLDKNGGGTLSIGSDHYVLKLSRTSVQEPSKTTERSSIVSPEAAEYMAKVGALIKRHWRRSLNMPKKHVIVRFYINADGTIDDLKLDPSSDQKLDEYTVRAFDAVKQATPFPAPPASLLVEDNKVEIKFAFDVNHKNPSFGFGRGFFYSP